MIAQMGRRGRGFDTVTHPNPEKAVIHGEWDVRVEVGELLL